MALASLERTARQTHGPQGTVDEEEMMHRPIWRRHARVRTVALITLVVAATAAAVFAATLSAFTEPPGIDGLASSSHPDPARWYNDQYPAFNWQTAQGVAGYSWALTRLATSEVDWLVEAEAGAQFLYALHSSVGSGPSGVAAVDLDGDDIRDVVTANRDSGTLSVLIGYGDGTFAPGVPYDAGLDPCSVTVVDLDGDGRRDLATSDRAGDQVGVFWGSGDGTFATMVGFPTGASPHSVAAADLNGDGLKDLVTADQDGDSVSVLLGAGGRAFAAPVGYATGEFPSTVALADLDGDGDVDAVTANYVDSSVSVLLGAGDGSFAAKTDHATGTGTHGVALADLDGDGDQDIVTANYIWGASVLTGKGDGTFNGPIDYQTGAGALAVALGDVGGDGVPDIVTADFTANSVSVLYGNGDATFAEAATHWTGTPPAAVALGDFDGDGKLDAAYADYTAASAGILLNTIPDRVAAFGPRADGTWYFHIRTVDGDYNRGPTSTLSVNIDTRGPTTRAPASATVKRYSTAALKYRVDDPRPGSPTATVSIKIKNSKGVVVKTLKPGVKNVNTTYYAKFTCSLAVGTYRFYVYATDQARNVQVKIGSNKLVVK
jgi:hypothetical protein